MSVRIIKNFMVVKFKQLPQNGMYEYQCIPSSWIKCYNEHPQITVAYPTQMTTVIERLMRNGKEPLLKWPLFPAVAILGLDSYTQWPEILAFIQENDTFDEKELIKTLEPIEHFDVQATPTIVTPDIRNSQANNTRNSNDFVTKYSKRLSFEDSGERKRQRLDPQQPSTSGMQNQEAKIQKTVKSQPKGVTAVQHKHLTQLMKLCQQMTMIVQKILDTM